MHIDKFCKKVFKNDKLIAQKLRSSMCFIGTAMYFTKMHDV